MRKHIHTIGITLVIATAIAFAQGPLTPPGAPAPSMKTLTELSAQMTALSAQLSAVKDDQRTVIATVPYAITTPGSYVLGKNLDVRSGDAISIVSSEVTLDLNGFTISSSAPGGNGYGISIGENCMNIRISNGVIKGTTTYSGSSFVSGGFSFGIGAGQGIRNVTVSSVSVSGIANSGIYLGSTNLGTIVERCTVSTCGGGGGINARIVRDSSAVDCWRMGIEADFVSDCEGSSVNTGVFHGIIAQNVRDSKGTSVAGTGILSYESATGCSGISFSGIGLDSTNANHCTGRSTTDYGLSCTTAFNSVGITLAGTSAIRASGTTSYCYGRNGTGFGPVIQAGNAVACDADGGSGNVSAPKKFLGTP